VLVTKLGDFVVACWAEVEKAGAGSVGKVFCPNSGNLGKGGDGEDGSALSLVPWES